MWKCTRCETLNSNQEYCKICRQAKEGKTVKTVDNSPLKRRLPLVALVVMAIFALGFVSAYLLSGNSTGVEDNGGSVIVENDFDDDELEYELELPEIVTDDEPDQESDLSEIETEDEGITDEDIFVMINNEGHFGMMNGAGEVVVPFEFDGFQDSFYYNGISYYFMYKHGETLGGVERELITSVLDGSGNFILRDEGRFLEMNTDGLISRTIFPIAEEQMRTVVWDLNGNYLFSIDDIVFQPEGFTNGFALAFGEDPIACETGIVSSTYFKGFVDLTGNIVFGSEYLNATSFDTTGEAAVQISSDEDWVIINENGERLRSIPNTSDFDEISNFSPIGIAMARESETKRIGLINKYGEQVSEFFEPNPSLTRPTRRGLAPLNRAGLANIVALLNDTSRYGQSMIINEHGEIIKSSGIDVENMEDMLVIHLFNTNPVGGSQLIRTTINFRRNPRFGLANSNGEEILPPEFLGIWPMNNDQWILVQGEEYNGIKDLEGNWLFVY